ncbi:leucine-rich repeat domain-containing protein, partial [Polaribacter sp. Z022]|uniref:leucine-rich repeat domain-containing protein n=1 Tax=Polaribacter sp. Z022 TaxID=2927125 RepID=UPI0032E3EF10|nr:hypothetical protein [Polaribacter sp. Z022]
MKTNLLILFAFISIAIKAQVSQAERQALINFYNATDGDNWTNNTNWDTDPNSSSDVSTWNGIVITTISGIDYVTEINLPQNNLSGILVSLSDLTRLTALNVGNNSTISGVVDLSQESIYYTNLTLNNTAISSLKLHKSLVLNIKDTPNLGCVEVPTTSLSYYDNLSMDNFDLGVKITDNCNGMSKLDDSERAALQAIYVATNGDSWSYRTYSSTELTSGASPTDTKGFETSEFNGVRKITKLYLSGMGLNGAIPQEIDDFTELLELNLSSNSINNLPTEIGNISKLTLLNLDINNSITTLPTSIGNLSELNSLTFNKTKIDLLPTTIGNLSKLNKLEFGNTVITLLPPEIGNLTELTRLVAAPNNIASIPTELGLLTKLTYLDFANCQLSNTPAAFANLKELETLYLNNNELQVVAGLGGFTKLKHLRLHNNRLGEDNQSFNTDLPEDLSDLALLEELTLYNNQLTKLPTNIGNLNKLTSLKLYNNRLTTLPSTINGLTSLIELQLQGNELTVLPTTIGGLTSLEKLHLSQYSSNNKISVLPDEIGDLSSLKELYIENMRSYENGIYTYYLTSLPSTMNK